MERAGGLSMQNQHDLELVARTYSIAICYQFSTFKLCDLKGVTAEANKFSKKGGSAQCL